MRSTLWTVLGLLSITLASCAEVRTKQSAPSAEPRPVAAAAPRTAPTLTSPLAQAEPPAAPPAAPPVAPERLPGTLFTGETNVRRFNPAHEPGMHVPLEALDMASIMETLGEEGVWWYQHVMTLANAYFEGRAGGLRGFERATEYLEFHFKQLGLEPAFPAPGEAPDSALVSYHQPFEYPADTVIRNYTLLASGLSWNGAEQVYGTDFVILGNSGTGTITAPLTFVGYAINEGRDGYTSFDPAVDLTGRIAVMFRYEPLNDEGKSRWADQRFSPSAGLSQKFMAVMARGAAGILMINPPGAVDGAKGLESLERSGSFSRALEVPSAQLSHAAAESLLASASGLSRGLLEWQKLADSGELKTLPLSDEFKVTLTSEVKVESGQSTWPSANAGAILRGSGALADEWVVIGGHYDHLGWGRGGSLHPNPAGLLHPGADDNASGTAGVLLTAKRMKAEYDRMPAEKARRSVLFLGFGAEEAGLHGSAWYCRNPTIPLDRTNLMINMDMIGRLRHDELMLGGTGTATEFDEMLPRLIAQTDLRVHGTRGGRGPSDHSNFYGKNMPVLFFFTGMHDDYHRPSDEGHTVNPVGALRILDLVKLVAMECAMREGRLTFARDDSRPAPRGADGGPAPSRTGARVSLGVMPNYAERPETGVLVDGVTAGSPAEEAGVKTGDILLAWNGEELTGGQRLAERLRDAKPGDRIKLSVKRGDRVIELEAVLRERAAPPSGGREGG